MAQPKKSRKYPRPIPFIKNQYVCELHKQLLQYAYTVDALHTAEKIKKKKWQPAPLAMQCPIF